MIPECQYFSSLERLRLAQDGVHHADHIRECSRPFTATTTARPASRYGCHPPTQLDQRLLHYSRSTRNRLRKPSRSGSRSQSITQEDITHFASLPPALQRKYYSREDQILLASRVNTVILDAADEAVYKQYHLSNLQTTPHHRLLSSSRSQPQLNLDHSLPDEEMDTTQPHLEAFKWLDQPENLDLSLYDYHAAVAETAVKPHEASSTQASFRSLSSSSPSSHRRSLSRRSFSARASCSAINSTSVPVPSAIMTNHQRKKTPTISLDPGATHYQDPAARMKLRVYLASPQKFDEAIEFGFPSLQQSSATLAPRSKSDSRSAEETAGTFYNDDTPSLSDDEDKDSDDFESPQTPSAAAFSSAYVLGPSNDSSLDRSSFRPKVTREIVDSYVHAPVSNREMTLHMTLTRPDLRSPNDLSSPKDINSTPLEQPPMIFTDSPTTFWDSLPDEESKMKKLFRKLKLRT